MIEKNLTENKKIEKPQLSFSDPIDNTLDHPFVPKIKKKYNSQHTLDPKLFEAQNNPKEFFERNVIMRFLFYDRKIITLTILINKNCWN